MAVLQCRSQAVGNIDALKRKLTRILKDNCDVEEVLQDAYVRVLEFQSKLETIDNVPAFYYRVAYNIAIDKVRRNKRSDKIIISSDECEDIKIKVMHTPCSTPSAHDQLQHKQALASVLEVLSELPPKCRRAYLLSCACDLTYGEIACEIGVTASMIEKYVARARRHVRESTAPIHRLNS